MFSKKSFEWGKWGSPVSDKSNSHKMIFWRLRFEIAKPVSKWP
jgi:hypothetical protein